MRLDPNDDGDDDDEDDAWSNPCKATTAIYFIPTNKAKNSVSREFCGSLSVRFAQTRVEFVSLV